MNDEPFEVVRGSGYVFANFGYSNAAVQQLKALLAAEIIGVLDDRVLTVRVCILYRSADPILTIMKSLPFITPENESQVWERRLRRD